MRAKAVALVGIAAALSLAAAPASQAGGGISLEMTVQVDPTPLDEGDQVCEPSADSIKAPRGTPLDLCYKVSSTNPSDLTRHDLTDSVFGPILDDFPFTLVKDASAFLIKSADAQEKVVHEGRWVAAGNNQIHQASDEIRIKVKTCRGYKNDMRDHLIGGKGADELTGPDDGAVICGLRGKDVLTGGADKDVLIGGPGKDTINGGDGKDTCFLERKDDAINCEKEKKA